jgi:hypothetical protein
MAMPDGSALDQLKDIHLPEPVSFWPLAPGWYLLAGVVLLIAVAGVWLYKQRRSIATQQATLNQLDTLQQRLRRDPQSLSELQQLSELVRRYALALFPQREVAGLHGDAWLAFLDRTGGDGKFSSGPGQALVSAPYQPQPEVDVDSLVNLIRRWIRRAPRYQTDTVKGERHD